MSASANLTELHHLHCRLRDVREQLAAGPRQLKARENALAQLRATVVKLEETLKQTRLAADRKGLDLRTLEGKLDDLRIKLNAASTNREFDSLRGQISADEAAKSVLEDEILDHLERVDRLKVEIAAANEKIRHSEADRTRFAAEFETQAVGLREVEGGLLESLRSAEHVLTGEALIKYRRLVDAHGADALSPVENSVCTGCYVAMTPQQRVLLNSGQIMFCSTCGRLMYLPT